MIKFIRRLIAMWKYRKIDNDVCACGDDVTGHSEYDDHCYTNAKEYYIDKYVNGDK